MTSQVVINPWEAAMNPPQQVQAYWGQVSVFPRLVVLMKGVGKVDYTEGAVMPDGSEARPVTAVQLVLQPLVDMGLQFDITREPIAQGWGEWGDITLPSLREIGVLELPALHLAWVKVDMESTGRSYTDKTGEKREATAFKFLKLFPSEAECRTDYILASGKSGAPVAQTAAQQPTNGGDKDRETALKFAKVYVKNACHAGGDLEKARIALATMLAQQPLISKFFTVDSPEIVEMMISEVK